MKIGPLFFYILSIFFSCKELLQAQPLLDTIGTGFRKELLQHYESNLSAGDFAKSIPQKRIRKSFNKISQYRKADFVSEISEGKFIYHPKYSPLLQSIFAQIRQANIGLIEKDCKVVLTTGPHAEAFSMENDLIGIDLSLLLHFENEYQIGFTIAHETAHQVLKHGYHSVARYIESSKSEDLDKEIAAIGNQEYNKMKGLTALIKRVAYDDADKRRKFEQQADSLGFLFFSKAYPGREQEANETLRILKEIAAERDSLSISDFVKVFVVNGLKFNPQWIVDNDIKNYSYKKAKTLFDEDSLKTHYDIDFRIDYLKRQFDIKGIPVGKTVLYTELTKEIRGEFVFNLYFLKSYGESLYQALLAMKEDYDSAVLKKMLYDNLVQLRKARNTYTLNKYLPNQSPDYTNSYNQYLSLIRNLKKDELDQVISFYKY